MKFKDKAPVLILIGMQQGYVENEYWGGQRSNPKMEENLGKLLKFWRSKELPVIHVKHKSTNEKSPLHKKNPGCKLMAGFKPVGNEPLFKKKASSAFIGTRLEQYLIENDYKTLVFGGLTANHAVSSSVRMANSLGFKVFVLNDGTAAFDRRGMEGVSYSADLIHQVSLTNLNEEFATVFSCEKMKKTINLMAENE